MDTYAVTDDRGHTATWDYDSAALTDVVCDWLDMGQMVSGYSATVTQELGDSLKAHEEAWARRVGEALAELRAVTQIGLLSH